MNKCIVCGKEIAETRWADSLVCSPNCLYYCKMVSGEAYIKEVLRRTV